MKSEIAKLLQLDEDNVQIEELGRDAPEGLPLAWGLASADGSAGVEGVPAAQGRSLASEDVSSAVERLLGRAAEARGLPAKSYAPQAPEPRLGPVTARDGGSATRAALRGKVLAEPFYSVTPVGDRLGWRVRRWQVDPRVVIVDVGDGPPVVRRGGEVIESAVGWIIDARSGPGGLVGVSDDEGREPVLWVDHGEIGVGHAVPVDRWTAALLRMPPVPDEISLSLPTLEWLAGGRRLQAWLEEEVRRMLGSPALIEQVAGVGLIGRLGDGAVQDPGSALAELLGGAPSAKGRAEEWARSLSGVELERIELVALDEAGRLSDEIAQLHDIAFGEFGPDGMCAVARGRDDLESVAFLLRVARPDVGERLGRYLAELDEDARRQQSAFDLVVSFDRRLAEVGWQHPELWWGVHEG